MSARRPLALACLAALAVASLTAARPADIAPAADADPQWQEAVDEEDVTRPQDASRDATMAASRDVMARLFAAQPALRAAMDEAAGYVTVAGTGAADGTALAVLQRTRQEVYLTFASDGAGDASAPPVDLVFVIARREVLGNLVFAGRDFDGGIAATMSPDGAISPFPGAVWVAPDVWAYRLEGDRIANDEAMPAIRLL
jgi:hypothetical protein